MINKSELKKKFGIGVHMRRGANLTFFEFGMHAHDEPEDEWLRELDDLCPFRTGVYVCICNFEVGIGTFWSDLLNEI